MSLSDENGNSTLSEDAQLLSMFAPLHKSLCASLKTLTGTDCEEAGLNITSLSSESQQAMIESPSIKLIFADLDQDVKAIGALSPALANYIAQASLQITNSKTDSSDIYKPSKLDALLMRPLQPVICEALTTIFQHNSAILPQAGLSFDALGFGKSEMKDFGELAELRLEFNFLAPESKTPLEKPKAKTKSKSAKAAQKSTSSLLIQIFLPLARLEAVLHSRGLDENADALVIDASNPWALHMRDAVKKADMPIRAVVESCQMTIAECTRLEIGQVIGLPGVSLNSVGIFIDMETENNQETEMETIQLAQGSLGIFKKNRALKLTENIDPSFTHDCDWLTI